MPNASFDLRALPPVDVLQKFVAVLKEAFESRSIENTVVNTNLMDGHYQFGGGIKAADLPNTPGFKEALADMGERSAYLNVRMIRTWIPFNTPNQKVQFTYESSDGIYANVSLEVQDPQTAKDQFPKTAGLIHQHFNITRKAELIGQELPRLEQDKLRYYERALSDLTAAIAKLGEVTTQQIERQAAFLQEKSAELDKQASERAAKMQKDFEDRLSDLAKERDALAKEKADLDIRRSTAARRSLLTDMRTQIGAKFNVTTETVTRRRPVHIAAITAMAVGAGLMGFSIWKLFRLPSFDWRYMSTFWSGLLLAGTTLIYYLRWNNHWFAQLARDEFNTHKMNIDVLRASWVAEMLIEWKEEKDRPFPTELLTAVTEGLFRGVEWTPGDHHPVSEVARMVNSVSKLKVTKDGLELSKKGD